MKEVQKNTLVKDMISIMLPCFNGEKFIERLFSDITNQTYKNIQVIFVNDGSVDKTEEMAFRYCKNLEAEGMMFQYIKKKNGGVASAINMALPALMGEYCMWFDVDDRMSSDHVEKKYLYLKSHADKDLVMCTGYIYNENDSRMQSVIGTLGEQAATSSLFEDLLFERRNCTPGLFMARTEALLEGLNYHEIVELGSGQNMQLLLPISLNGREGYILDKLFFYIYRDNSHSHMKMNFNKRHERLKNINKVKKSVINELSITSEYKEQLYRKLDRFLKYQLIMYLDDAWNYDIDLARKIWHDFFEEANIRKNRKGRKIYCWGKYKSSYNVVKALNEFEDIGCDGFIESDITKCDSENDVLYRDNICREDMYLIIPLKYHADIIDALKKGSFAEGDDYYYPMSLLAI